MKQTTLINVLALCIALCSAMDSARATSPCITPTINELHDVVTKSDYIIHGEILKNGMLNRGTHIRVIDSYKGDNDSARLFVSGWFYNSPPLTAYEKGDQIVFILSNTSYNDDIVLTDDSWKSCVPSIVNVSDDGTVYNPYTQERILAEDYIQALMNHQKQDTKN